MGRRRGVKHCLVKLKTEIIKRKSQIESQLSTFNFQLSAESGHGLPRRNLGEAEMKKTMSIKSGAYRNFFHYVFSSKIQRRMLFL